MELLKHYDFSIVYHPGKRNTIADALSKKICAELLATKWKMVEDFISWEQFPVKEERI